MLPLVAITDVEVPSNNITHYFVSNINIVTYLCNNYLFLQVFICSSCSLSFCDPSTLALTTYAPSLPEAQL